MELLNMTSRFSPFVVKCKTHWEYFLSYFQEKTTISLHIHSNKNKIFLQRDHSSVEVRVLCQGGAGGQVVYDWTKMQDGRWKAAF